MGVTDIPAVWVGIDDALRDLGLGIKKPVPSKCRKVRICAVKVLANWNAIQQHQMVDALFMVEGQSKCDVASAIVSDEMESVVAEDAHQLCHVPSEGALGMGAVVSGRCGASRTTVTAKIRTNHRISGLD